MAITLSKKLAKELREKNKNKKLQEENDRFENFLPNAEDIESIKLRYKSMVKASQGAKASGTVRTFRIKEEQDKYWILKSTDAEKSSLNILAILPKLGLEGKTFQQVESFKALIMDTINDIPIVNVTLVLIENAAHIPQKSEDIAIGGDLKLYGIVDLVNHKGVNVRFCNGLKKIVLMKDCEDASKVAETYTVG